MKKILALALLTSAAVAPFAVGMSTTESSMPQTEEAVESTPTTQAMDTTSTKSSIEATPAEESMTESSTKSPRVEAQTMEESDESSTSEESMPKSRSTKMEQQDSSKMMSHEEVMNEIMALKGKLKGKVVSLPGSLEKDGTTLKARMLTLYADALRECGELNFNEGSAALRKYEEAAQRVEEAADALENLPVKRVMKKSFENLDEWMQLKMESHLHKAELLKAAAKDLNDTDLEEKAEKLASMVEKFKEKATDKGAKEESEENEGCPLTQEDDEYAPEEMEEERAD